MQNSFESDLNWLNLLLGEKVSNLEPQRISSEQKEV